MLDATPKKKQCRCFVLTSLEKKLRWSIIDSLTPNNEQQTSGAHGFSLFFFQSDSMANAADSCMHLQLSTITRAVEPRALAHITERDPTCLSAELPEAWLTRIPLDPRSAWLARILLDLRSASTAALDIFATILERWPTRRRSVGHTDASGRPNSEHIASLSDNPCKYHSACRIFCQLRHEKLQRWCCKPYRLPPARKGLHRDDIKTLVAVAAIVADPGFALSSGAEHGHKIVCWRLQETFVFQQVEELQEWGVTRGSLAQDIAVWLWTPGVPVTSKIHGCIDTSWRDLVCFWDSQSDARWYATVEPWS